MKKVVSILYILLLAIVLTGCNKVDVSEIKKCIESERETESSCDRDSVKQSIQSYVDTYSEDIMNKDIVVDFEIHINGDYEYIWIHTTYKDVPIEYNDKEKHLELKNIYEEIYNGYTSEFTDIDIQVQVVLLYDDDFTRLEMNDRPSRDKIRIQYQTVSQKDNLDAFEDLLLFIEYMGIDENRFKTFVKVDELEIIMDVWDNGEFYLGTRYEGVFDFDEASKLVREYFPNIVPESGV